MVSRIGPPAGHPHRLAPRPPPSKAGDIPCQSDMLLFINACVKGDSADIRWFLRYYPHQWGVHCKGKTGLMFAAENGHEYAAKLLLELHSDINAVDQTGMTALLYAAEAQHPNVVSLLLEKGASPQAAESSGWNAIHLAARKGNTQVLEMLLAKAPSMIDKRNNDELTPLRIAVANGNDDAVRFLLDRGAGLGRDDKEYQDLLKAARDRALIDIAKMLADEPERRRVLREAEIDAAVGGGLTKSFSVKRPMKLLKEKRQEKPAETPTEAKKEAAKETMSLFALMQRRASARGKGTSFPGRSQ
ncbi:MAG: ankyrin repeat domain-containing protein [Alphaproteobacteria bacterium]